jgi:hypothetical protein
VNNSSSGKVVVMSKPAWVDALYRWRHQRLALDVRHAWRKSTMRFGMRLPQANKVGPKTPRKLTKRKRTNMGRGRGADLPPHPVGKPVG